MPEFPALKLADPAGRDPLFTLDQKDLPTHASLIVGRKMACIWFLKKNQLVLIVVSVIAAVLFGSDLLHDFSYWGYHDGVHYQFHFVSTYRSIVEFAEAPLWNPWYLGGMPLLANPQTFVPDPWFLVDLLMGPIPAIRIKIVGQFALGLAGAYWCARQFRLSRIAATYFAGTFIFSTWLALHVQAGHYTFLCGTYIPWVVGFLHRSRSRTSLALIGSGLLTLMAFQGGVHILILTSFLTGLLALCWAVEERSLRPIASLMLMWLCFVGLSAVKLMPTFQLISQYPRTMSLDPGGKLVSVVGGAPWGKYQRLFFGAGSQADPVSDKAGVEVRGERGSNSPDGSTEPGVPSANARQLSKWDMPLVLIKIFLGREQRSLKTYYPVQGFGWHEYGAYIGAVAVVLLVCSPFLVLRSAWPWMVVGSSCFLVAVGNFAPFAPWPLLHHLPVISNMRVPSRFLIPTVFAFGMLAGMALDQLANRLGALASREKDSRAYVPRRWVQMGAALLVAVALADSFLVGRHSLQGAFPTPPLPIASRLPSIVTVQKLKGRGIEAVLSNYCLTTRGEEAGLPIPVRVTPREDSHYRGELYFVPDSAETAGGEDRVELLKWSPNSVRVGVDAKSSGWIVLNRNWAEGWIAEQPYKGVSYEGLIAAHVERGAHTIRFIYRPLIVPIGFGVSIMTLAIVAGAFILSFRLRRRGILGF